MLSSRLFQMLSGRDFSKIEPWTGLLEHALIRDGTSELHLAALQALLDAAARDVTAFAVRYRDRLPWLRGFLGHVHATGCLFSKL